ncbi:helix-turn-helix domain-containing protein [Paenibacillus hodogayensis]|uniref:Helix-turn-helix domain-containing protein n=1 Tax=Paenibacillus hodogayensis TaxID=279208 RepID=A0ABV5W0R2_9BACL
MQSFEPDGRPKERLAEIRTYMDRHYSEPISVASLAQMANLSPGYFVELFKKTYGRSALDYLTDLRINRAKRYLAESDERLRDIAVKVGYSDEFYFSRKFKKEVGVSPSEFARNYRKRVAVCSSSVIGHLLALDVLPEAAPLDPKWTFYYYNGYRTLIKYHLKLTAPYTEGTFEENADLLTQLRPDAIIGTDRLHPAEKSKMTHIAPAFFVSTKGNGWREQLRSIALFLNRIEAADRWIDRYDCKVRDVREQTSAALGNSSVLVLRIYGPDLFLYWNRGLDDVLYEDLRLRPACGRGPSHKQPLTLAQLAQLEPDRILLVVCPEASSRAHWLALQHSAAWRRLKAVADGYVYPIPSDPWFEYSPVSIMRMLDEALLLFTGKCPNAYPSNVHGGFCAT